jgi:hypothetical protein
MGYTINSWKERMAGRSDITSRLTHLTKQNQESKLSTLDILFKILDEGTIVGSEPGKEPGFIVGSTPAVCFQEAPLYSMGQNVYYEQEIVKEKKANGVKNPKIRYIACGLSFEKPYCYKKGARPVLYEKTDDAKKILPANEYWRIVNFDLENENNIIDWTHEREWRVPGNFEFEIEEVTIIVPNHNLYREFIKRDNKEYAKRVKGIINLASVFY